MNIKDASDNYVSPDFSKIKLGLQTLDDAVLSLGDYKRINPRWGDKR